MEPTFFRDRPQQLSQLCILSWNINGVKTKLEEKVVQDLLYKYDLICLNEVKTPLEVHFPGYVTYKSAVRGSNQRGGTALLIKNVLSSLIAGVNVRIEDQIWIKFRFAPTVSFGFCYIPPTDSHYYSHNSFSSIQEQLMTDTNSNAFCVVGDLNARFGTLAREFPERVKLPESSNYSYPYLPDDVRVPNDNALILSNICMETGMVLVNNLKIPTNHFRSDKTYRKGSEWVSEIDTCTVSSNLVSDVSGFAVIMNDSLPSDHAPITITLSVSGVDLDGLLTRSQYLGNHAVIYDKKLCNKPINMCNIDETF